MKFGMLYANRGPAARPEYAVALAQACEEAGFDSLWAIEHVVVPDGYESPYPYSPDGRMPDGEDMPFPDPLIWLAWVGAQTTRIKLATGVLILPQRNPVILAKEVATLDALTGGRVVLGVGVGWMREEFEAVGVPFEQRGARTDEAVEVLRALWCDDEPTFSGRFSSFSKAKCVPRPVQPGGVPIVVGGHSDAAARRAGRLGDGFIPVWDNFDELRHFLDVMHQAAVEAGRDPAAIEVTTGMAQDIDGVRRYEDLGVARLLVPQPSADIDVMRKYVARYAEKVIAPVNR